MLFERSVIFSFAQEVDPAPELTPDEIPAEVSVGNEAGVDNNIDQNSETGENTIELEAPLVVEESPAEPSEIQTGDSVTVVNVENQVNSNIINSEFINHTLNIYLGDEAGDIDLNLLAQNAINKVFSEDQNLDGVVSVSALSVDNFAYVENNIDAEASTGGNGVESSGDGEITTGNSYAAISVLNNVNTNIIDSKVHLVTINIFGSLAGNIVLPSVPAPDQAGCCQESVISQNVALVVNNISADAISGQNQVAAVGPAEITTGQAETAVNVYNLVNTNLINIYFNHFEINNMGEWSGSFLGFNEDQIEDPPQNQDCPGCIQDTSINNFARVINNVSAGANTGGNSIKAGTAKITTGNAYTAVLIANFVNTNIINSTGFIGFINIFGRFTGDIGGSEKFPSSSEPEASVQSQSQESQQKDSGGILEVEHITNVGTHVLPGDTVTFFAKIKNPGTGTVYGTKLTIELLKNGINYGGTTFDLGDIKSQKAVKITTGLVLSKSAKGGEYTAVVTASGNVGPGDSQVSASSESKFYILALTPGVIGSTIASDVPLTDSPEVLGSSTGNLISDLAGYWQFVFLGLGFTYTLIFLARKRLEGEIIISPAFIEFLKKKKIAFAGGLFTLLAAIGLIFRRTP